MDIIHFPGNGRPAQTLTVDTLPVEGFAWLDVYREDEPDWALKLAQLAGIQVHEGHVEDSLNVAHPSFYDATESYDMVIFRSLLPEHDGLEMETRANAFFLTDRLLVTVRSRDSRSVNDIRHRVLQGSMRLPLRPSVLMHMIMNAMVDRFLAMRDPMSEHIRTWREVLLDPENPFDDWLEVLGYRSRLQRLEALCEEQEDAILAWREEAESVMTENLKVRFTDLVDHIRRISKFAANQSSDIESLVQLHFSAVAHRTNQIVRILTLVSVIFLPLNLIAGIFGMNFHDMIGLDNPYGYFAALIGMAILALVLLVIFRIKRWF